MKTLQQLASTRNIPMSVAWSVADLAERCGKQELFTKQMPQRLRVFREHALIESTVSSNRIEGVTIEQSRVKPVILGKSLLRDRDEEEIRGYRDALKLIHEQHYRLSISEKTIKQLHVITLEEKKIHPLITVAALKPGFLMYTSVSRRKRPGVTFATAAHVLSTRFGSWWLHQSGKVDRGEQRTILRNARRKLSKLPRW